jgi:hypothetical protein
VPRHQARSEVDGSKARVGVPIPVVLRSHRPTRPIACSMLRCVGPTRACPSWRKSVLTEMAFGPGARGPRGNQSGKPSDPDRAALALGDFHKEWLQPR